MCCMDWFVYLTMPYQLHTVPNVGMFMNVDSVGRGIKWPLSF
jgi:hypothetical protein